MVFLKREGDKTSSRDLYLVIDILDQGTISICKLRDVLAGKLVSMDPKRFHYTVKQTDVFLAPNQPEITDCQYAEDQYQNTPVQIPPVGNTHSPNLSSPSPSLKKHSQQDNDLESIFDDYLPPINEDLRRYMEFEWSDLESGGEEKEDEGSEVTGGSNPECVGGEDG